MKIVQFYDSQMHYPALKSFLCSHLGVYVHTNIAYFKQ